MHPPTSASNVENYTIGVFFFQMTLEVFIKSKHQYSIRSNDFIYDKGILQKNKSK